MKKKILNILMCIVLILGFTACGKKDNKEDNELTKIVINSKRMNIKQEDFDKLKKIFNGLKYKNNSCEGREHYVVELDGKKYFYYRSNNTVGYNNKCAEIDGDDLSDSFRILTFVESDKNMDDIKNVQITMKEGTFSRSGMTIIITDTNTEPYQYGESFRIDKEEEGTWQELEIIGKGNFDSIAYNVDENNELELEQNWEQIYGILENGKYRLVKNVCLNEGCYKRAYFSIGFIIET